MSAADKVIGQCRKPSGFFGRFILWRMNRHHSKLTDWGLSHVDIEKTDTLLDVGCGGGRTVSKLAAMASDGKVWGIDYSEDSVTAAHRYNTRWIDIGRAVDDAVYFQAFVLLKSANRATRGRTECAADAAAVITPILKRALNVYDHLVG